MPADVRNTARYLSGTKSWVPSLALVVSWAFFGPGEEATAAIGHLELRVVDELTGQPVAVTMQLWDAKNRSRKVRGVPAFGNRFVVDGMIVLKLPPGAYTFKIERGMEYLDRHGNFLIRSAARDNHTVMMKRLVDMRALGWHSMDLGNLGARRTAEAFMRAFDLHRWCGVTTHNKTQGRQLDLVGERVLDLRGVFDTHRQLAVLRIESPESVEATRSANRLLQLGQARPKTHCQAMDIAAIDFPMWVASGALDAVTVLASWPAKPTAQTMRPDQRQFPGRRGAARWREHLYHQLLETGLRIAPSATSFDVATGSPSGQLRTYVMAPDQNSDDLTQRDDAFWAALERGQTMLTNGPLIIAKVNGQPPGSVFEGFPGETVELKPTLTLHTKEKISYLELLKNREVAHQVRLDDWVKAGGALPAVRFTASGWMLIRAVIDEADDYRMAMTAPYYVEFASQPRISTAATTFFADWAQRRLQETKGLPTHTRHAAALEFWEARRDIANAP